MAAKEFSFDIVSEVNDQEVRNAVQQAQKELANRYDFKGGKSDILFEKDEITLIGDDEFKMEQLKDIVINKLLKRGIDMRQIGWGKQESGSGLTIRQKVEFKKGIATDEGKKLVKEIKDNKTLKVSATIQGEAVRVTGKDKDDLQKAIAFVKTLELNYPVDFQNYR